MHYFTVLRNPHAHRLSHLRFIIQERAGFGVPRHVGDSVGDILRWLYSDSSHLSFECPQTNHLALHTWCASAPKRCDPATYAAWRIDDRAAYQRDRLAIAKSILDSFLAVGVVERLAATAEIVRRRAAQYGLRLLPVSAIPVTNVTDPAIDSDASLLESGRVGDVDLDTLSDDEALYAYAERLLDAANNHAPLAAG